MYNIWNGTIKLNGKELEIGQKLRIDLYDMSIEDVKELKSFEYKEVTEGHKEGTYTRMYIEIIAKKAKKEIKMTDCFTKKEFDKKVRYNDLEESKAVIWNDEQGLYIEVYTNIDDEYITIAYSNNFDDTEANEEYLIKNLSKAITKYKKWFKDNDLELQVIKEITNV